MWGAHGKGSKFFSMSCLRYDGAVAFAGGFAYSAMVGEGDAGVDADVEADEFVTFVPCLLGPYDFGYICLYLYFYPVAHAFEAAQDVGDQKNVEHPDLFLKVVCFLESMVVVLVQRKPVSYHVLEWLAVFSDGRAEIAG